MEICPAWNPQYFYIHLETSRFIPGTGIYKFTTSQLEKYRKSELDPVYGKELLNIFNGLLDKGYNFGCKNYKKIPNGYISGGGNKELLLYNGLYVSESFNIPKVFFTAKFIDFYFKEFKETLPIQKWLSGLNQRM
jgi:hypothetical protein